MKIIFPSKFLGNYCYLWRFRLGSCVSYNKVITFPGWLVAITIYVWGYPLWFSTEVLWCSCSPGPSFGVRNSGSGLIEVTLTYIFVLSGTIIRFSTVTSVIWKHIADVYCPFIVISPSMALRYSKKSVFGASKQEKVKLPNSRLEAGFGMFKSLNIHSTQMHHSHSHAQI